ncbi:MAG: gfo/Idh/MocA family oxidoreductase, partial [Clostridia bacterium]|nr:gfo/Idh/MocA family oxidoreductase [Clostridia bacterium]
LNATSPYEGWHCVINGSKGRLEAVNVETGIQNERDTDLIRVFDLQNRITEYVLPRHTSGHGGGDIRLLRNIFVGDQPDPLGHAAGSFDGANSVIIGALANKSIATGKFYTVDDELKF